MPGDVGLVASLIQRVIELVVDEDQLPEIRKRWELKRLHKEAVRALDRGDLDEYRRVRAEFERVSNAA